MITSSSILNHVYYSLCLLGLRDCSFIMSQGGWRFLGGDKFQGKWLFGAYILPKGVSFSKQNEGGKFTETLLLRGVTFQNQYFL